MTLALWCVLAAALMPYLWIGIAKFGGERKLGPDANHHPRAWLDSLAGRQQRAHWAQLNAFEAFPPFAAGVIIAQMTGGSQPAIDALALAFIVLRLAHGYCYLADWATQRSLVWTAGILCVVGLFVTAAV